MKLYLVQDPTTGQFLRGFHAYSRPGQMWLTPDMSKARRYVSPGPAKTWVTKIIKGCPGVRPPHLLEFDLDPAQAKVIDVAGESNQRIKTAEARKLKRKQERNADLVKHYAQERDKLDARIKELSP